jgi:transposase-like protein
MVSRTHFEVACPFCSAKYPVVKREGTRKTSAGIVQKYYCRSCERYFSERTFPGTKHLPRIIFAAITYYNLGHTLSGVSKQLKRRHKASVGQSTIHSWVQKYFNVCSFSKLRGRYELVPDKTILSKRFKHDQIFTYKLHTLKLNLMGKSQPRMKDYLFGILRSFDSRPFDSGHRCSESVLFDKTTAKNLTTSTAPLLCRMGLETARRAVDRHDNVEKFFLANDLATVACEIPVFATGKEIRTRLPHWKDGNLHGHIDMLQNRRGLLVVMDYKPPPLDDTQVQNQLALYALLLSIRTGISIKNLKCGYFNELMHKEFYPSKILR